jgi:hypothetical protein
MGKRKRLTKAQRLLKEARDKPSPFCPDPRQLNLLDYEVIKAKAEGFDKLDAAIAAALKREGA